MSSFLEKLTEYNGVVNDFIWGNIGLFLLIGTGILMTILTKFFQVSHLPHWWSKTIGKMFSKDTHKKDKNSISPFQALCTALAATIGVGNIAGVAAAITAGGAGAVFWMWIAAFFGMMTNYSENVLGIYFRRRNKDGEWSGGAMYYLADGVGSKKHMKPFGKVLAVVFSLFTILASFGIGSMSQVNKIVSNFVGAFHVTSLENVEVFEGISLYSVIIGVVIMVLAALIIIGGLKRIAAFAERVVPFMVIAFVVGSLIIIGKNYVHIIPAFKSIFVTAFKPIPAISGVAGYTLSLVITKGFKRGVFSNEAGLGSSVMVHSNSSVREPVMQGMWGIFEVFADTIIVCTMTALVILTSGVYNLETGAIPAGATDGTLVGEAFNSVFSFGNLGSKFIAIAIFLFAFTTILGWSHYGKKAWEYLFGTKSTLAFKIIHIITILFGAIMTSSLAWDISDTFNGLMMIPNLIGVVILSPLVVKITKNYVDRRIKNKSVKPEYSFFPEYQHNAEDQEAIDPDGE
ncbi:MAG: sodium:alanine symporter family protein [Clostridia bacterium]|nr:sodium:alanine symporter family protein [Clostridia bacterium]